MEKRQYYIDWIRVLAFGALIFYHTGMFFVSWGWHVKNNEIVNYHEIWMELINPWRLSLLFFISGVGVSFALKSRTGWQFIGERTKRLLLPLIFGMLVIVPPQIYFERIQNHEITQSYLDFYPSVFNFVPYPAGNFSWHHLWFVTYLWVYSILATPLFTWLKNHSNIFKFNTHFGDYIKLLLCIFPLSITYILLSKDWEITHNLTSDWYNFTLSLLLFILGYIIGGQSQNWELIEKYRKINFGIAASIMTISLSYDAIFGPLSDEHFWVLCLNSVLKMLFIWCIILAICGFAKHHLNFKNSFIGYANRAVYPFYILHQTIIIIIGFYMADWVISPLFKFFLIVIGTFGLCAFLYHFLIRPYSIMRLLFGVK
ncbi:MAG: acyltransferase family protein [Bacteroidota bacterium]